LRLARGSSAYADDAAYRAFVLAGRLGRDDVMEEARALLPEGNFFAMKLGADAAAPDPATAPVGPLTAAALEAETGTELATRTSGLAHALHGVGFEEAAVGELLFALREAEAAGDVLATVELAELLQ